MLASRLQRHLASGASWGFSPRFLAPGSARTLLRGILEQLRFSLHHPPMHLIFDFHKRGFGVSFAPLFHIAQDLCARAEPGVLFHDLLFPISLVDGLILSAFLALAHPQCKKVSRTPYAGNGSENVATLVY